MTVPISKLENFKLDTTFGDDYVITANYEWILSERRQSGVTTWKTVRMIGTGAFGSVWLEKSDGRQLRAVKRIERHVVMQAGFSQELLALITLADYNHLFVQFLGWYESPRDIYFGMEYIEYGDLSMYMATDNEKAKGEAPEITRQILQGLDILHREGICHRDLKPQNVLVASRDPIWVKIADFGASKRSTHMSLRTACGTPGYVAPELLGMLPQSMFNCRVGFSHALDMWSLGCLVHELLTAQIPFLESSDGSSGVDSDLADDMAEPQTDMQLVYQYCNGGAFPMEPLLNANATDEAIRAVESMLQANPKDRVTARNALQSPWLVNNPYQNEWYTILEDEFAMMGIHLDPGKDQMLIRQIQTKGIAGLLPVTAQEDLAGLLTNVLLNELHVAASALSQAITHKATGGGDRPDPVQWTLRDAVIHGNIEYIKVLLFHGADVNATDHDEGQTVLQAATINGNIDTVQLLLKNGAEVNAKGDGQTALQEAIVCGNNGAIKLLLENGADVNTVGRDHGRTGLQEAIIHDNIDAIKLLLDHGVNVNATGRDQSHTALQKAIIHDNIEAFKLLLDHGANVDAIGRGRTALHEAIIHDNTMAIELLLKQSPDVNAIGRGPTALQVAIIHDNIEAFKLLLEHGVDVNTIGRGHTALQVAITHDNEDAIKLLVEHGADVNTIGREDMGLNPAIGNSSTNRATADYNSTLALIFLRQTALHAAIIRGDIHAIHELLLQGANVNSQSHKYRLTPLQTAVVRGDIGTVALLFELGAAVNGGSETHHPTAVQLAIGCGYINIAKLLLRHGANPYINSKANLLTTLDAIRKRNDKPMLKLLFDHANPRNRERFTAAEIAELESMEFPPAAADQLFIADAASTAKEELSEHDIPTVTTTDS